MNGPVTVLLNLPIASRFTKQVWALPALIANYAATPKAGARRLSRFRICNN